MCSGFLSFSCLLFIASGFSPHITFMIPVLIIFASVVALRKCCRRFARTVLLRKIYRPIDRQNLLLVYQTTVPRLH